MARVLCLDFDDTIVMENTARLVFERFAAPVAIDAKGLSLRIDRVRE